VRRESVLRLSGWLRPIVWRSRLRPADARSARTGPPSPLVGAQERPSTGPVGPPRVRPPPMAGTAGHCRG
jgi:hypothetical protein